MLKKLFLDLLYCLPRFLRLCNTRKIIGTIPALKFYVTVGDSNVGPTTPIRGSTNVAVTEGHREFPVAKVKKAFISWGV